MQVAQTKIDVLPGGGFVRIVSCMQPIIGADQEYNPLWTGDLEIVRNARVSHDADWRTGEESGADEKLVNYMHKNRHTSPFESMVLTFEVQAPIFILRQWHRHRTWSYNEISARYAKLDLGCYVPKAEKIGTQSATNKQARDIERTEVSAENNHMDEEAVEHITHAYDQAFDRYCRMITMGVPREIARCVLPVNSYSRMFATVNLHNLFHFLELRLDSHAQYEVRVYAEALLELTEQITPMAVKAFKEDLGV